MNHAISTMNDNASATLNQRMKLFVYCEMSGGIGPVASRPCG